LIDCSIKVAEGKEDLKALIKEHMDSFQKLVKKEKVDKKKNKHHKSTSPVHTCEKTVNKVGNQIEKTKKLVYQLKIIVANAKVPKEAKDKILSQISIAKSLIIKLKSSKKTLKDNKKKVKRRVKSQKKNYKKKSWKAGKKRS